MKKLLLAVILTLVATGSVMAVGKNKKGQETKTHSITVAEGDIVKIHTRPIK